MPESIIIALIGLFSGGLATAFVKILEKFLGKAKDRTEHDSGIRSELRLDLDRKAKELDDLREELRLLELQVQQWKIGYWSLYEVFFQLKLMGQVMAQANPELKTSIDSITAPHERKLTGNSNE